MTKEAAKNKKELSPTQEGIITLLNKSPKVNRGWWQDPIVSLNKLAGILGVSEEKLTSLRSKEISGLIKRGYVREFIEYDIDRSGTKTRPREYLLLTAAGNRVKDYLLENTGVLGRIRNSFRELIDPSGIREAFRIG